MLFMFGCNGTDLCKYIVVVPSTLTNLFCFAALFESYKITDFSLTSLDAALDREVADLPGPAPSTIERCCCTARSGKLYRARSRLYRSQILQVNMRLKALAEIYTMHSFALL